jgi:predicted phosphodiesterase
MEAYVKLMVLSDLHLEFGDFVPPEVDADVVVLAGDIHVGCRGVRWAAEHFNVPVVYVPGNHERYNGRLGSTVDDMRCEAATSNVFVLDRGEVVIDGVRFLGATLWTDLRCTGNQPLAELDARQHMADYQVISDDDGRPLTPEMLLEEHRKARCFLEQSLSGTGRDWSGKTVVVTHHAPCDLSISERFKREAKGVHLNASYASRLEGLLGWESVALWVHGHTHDSFDYELFGTRVVCNPRGYVGDGLNPGFDKALVVTL